MDIHTLGTPYGLVDIYKLIALVNADKTLKPVNVPINVIKECMTRTLWDNEDGTELFSPIDVIEGKVISSEHWERIQQCDESKYPVLVFEEIKNTVGISKRITDPDQLKKLVQLHLLDGNHRACKRMILKYSDVPTISVPWSLVEQSIITSRQSMYTFSRVTSLSCRTK